VIAQIKLFGRSTEKCISSMRGAGRFFGNRGDVATSAVVRPATGLQPSSMTEYLRRSRISSRGTARSTTSFLKCSVR
jgi:hypothetical protein